MSDKFEEQKNYVGFDWTQKWFHPPFWWLVNASAYIHDNNYTIGGTKADRLNADTGFFWRMLSDINKIEDYKKKKKAIYTAIIYFLCVRLFGWISFNNK